MPSKPRSNSFGSRSSPAPSGGTSSHSKGETNESGWDVEDSGWGAEDWGGIGSTNKTTVQSRPAKQRSASPPKESGWENSGWGEGDDWGKGRNSIDQDSTYQWNLVRK